MDMSRSQAIFGMAPPVEAPRAVSAYLSDWASVSQAAMALLTLDLRLVWANTAANAIFCKGNTSRLGTEACTASIRARPQRFAPSCARLARSVLLGSQLP